MKSTSLTSWGLVVSVALVLPALALTHPWQTDLVRRPPPPSFTAVAQRLEPPPSARLLVTDPRRAPHGISDALVRDLDHVPSGERIGVSTYWIDSQRILSALTRAYRRGVSVRVVVAGVERARTRGALALARLLDRPGDGSRWVWSAGAARTAGPGIMHEKTYRLSRVGLERWVVVTGSYNSADEQDAETHALMLRVAGRQDVYDAFRRIGAAQLRQRPVAHPLEEDAGPGWSAYFLPSLSADPDDDPVVRRLRALPASPRTVVRIAMYSMWGDRAVPITHELARLSRAGARVVLVAGPTVDATTRERLRAGGVRVVPGCWSDGTFTHSKDMAASFVRDGHRQQWTWVGSDNWTGRGMRHDQAVLGLRDPAVHREFVVAFDALLARRGGVYDGSSRAEE